MNPTIERLLSRALPRHELAALADADASVAVRSGDAVAPATLGGISARLVQLGVATPLAPGMRAMISIELDHGALRIDVPVEVIAAGRLSVVARMLAAPLVLRRRRVRDRKLEEALGIAPDAGSHVPLVA